MPPSKGQSEKAEFDELDLLRKPREKVVWRDRPVRSWKLTLIPILFFFVAIGIWYLIFETGLQGFDWYFVLLFTLMLYFDGGTSAAETLITEDRILRSGRRRGFWGNRADPPYSVSLNDVAEVSLADDGRNLQVEIRIAGSERVDVLNANQPQNLAARIAEGAGIARPPPVGRLEYFFRVCVAVASVPFLSSIIWTVELVPDAGSSSMRYFLTLVPFVAAYIFAFLLGMLLVGFVAVLFMPRSASAAEAANWFRLKPKKRLFRWIGWKSRPYLWLAKLVYGSDLTVSTERSA